MTGSFSKDDVIKLSNMAKISLQDGNDEFIASMTNNLNKIFDLVSQISSVETNVEPMHHPNNAKQRLREDSVSEVDTRKEMQELVDKQNLQAGMYLVPKVVE